METIKELKIKVAENLLGEIEALLDQMVTIRNRVYQLYESEQKRGFIDTEGDFKCELYSAWCAFDKVESKLAGAKMCAEIALRDAKVEAGDLDV